MLNPRFRGIEPRVKLPDADYAYCNLDQSENHVQITTKTYPNHSLHTAATEGATLEIAGTPDTVIRLMINGKPEEVTLRDLMTGSRTFYTGGFVSPAVCVHQAVPQSEYQHQFTLTHENQTRERDWYYVRVRQRNHQWAWSSPIWVEG